MGKEICFTIVLNARNITKVVTLFCKPGVNQWMKPPLQTARLEIRLVICGTPLHPRTADPFAVNHPLQGCCVGVPQASSEVLRVAPRETEKMTKGFVRGRGTKDGEPHDTRRAKSGDKSIAGTGSLTVNTLCIVFSRAFITVHQLSFTGKSYQPSPAQDQTKISKMPDRESPISTWW